MKATDLRIGNLVEYNGMYLPVSSIKSPKPLKDERFANKWLIELFDGASWIDCTIEEIKPIELTEDWILKMGFEKKSWFSQGIVIECVYYEMNGVIVYLIKSGFEIEIKHNDDQFNLLRVWKYLHELQNIFKIFTGEELTIK